MLNIEKYKDELIEMGIINIDKLGVKNGEPIICENHTTEICESCDIGKSSIECSEAIKDWLFSEYKEPEVDWSKVKVDTPVLVRNDTEAKWIKRHFAKYENGKVYVFSCGMTSWSYDEKTRVICWDDAKLPKLERKKSKSEIDWSKVAVDTPILVKFDEGNRWFKKYFARFVDGKIYAWKDGKASWTARDENDVCSWKHAKLTEMEDTDVNWSAIDIDTPILVRNNTENEWEKRHFAKYENGKVYFFPCGMTSWSFGITSLFDSPIVYNYVKLVENTECNHFCKLCGRPMRDDDKASVCDKCASEYEV